jgi:adenylyltransferase/sulfurtransferase
MMSVGEDEPRDIEAAELQQLLATGEPITLLDVREPFEWNISNLAPLGAVLIPMGDLPARIDELDPETHVVVYCRTGGRSARAAKFLAKRGFGRVSNLAGGINGWAEEVDPGLRTY